MGVNQLPCSREWWSKRSLTWWYVWRDEMDNEVSICCFYAVIRNCHTPFHFFISLGWFACWSLLWSRMESIKLAPSGKEEQRLLGTIRPSGTGREPEASPVQARGTERPPAAQLPRCFWHRRCVLPGPCSWSLPYRAPRLSEPSSLWKHVPSILITFTICMTRFEVRYPCILIARNRAVPGGFRNLNK